MTISSLFNKLMGKGVLGNVGDTVVSMGKEAQEVYAQHTNAVGKNVFGKDPAAPTYNRVDETTYGTDASDFTRLSKLSTKTPDEERLFNEILQRNTQRAEYTKYDAAKKTYDEQQGLLNKLSGATPLAKDETKETVLEAATKAGTINAEQKSALDYFMVQNEGKAYTPDSIDKTFAARDASVKDKFQTKSATFLETPTSMPGMSGIGEEGIGNEKIKKDLITLGAGAAVGGIIGSAMYDNAEGGMLTGLAGAGLGRGVARAVNKNLDSITAYGMKSVLGDELVKEGDKVGYSIDTAKMQKLGFKDANKLNVDVTTGKVTQAGKDFDLETQGKAYEKNATKELTMEDIGFGDKVDNKSDSVQTFTKTLINAEEQGVDTAISNLKNQYKTQNKSKSINAKAKQNINLKDGEYQINIAKGAKPTNNLLREEVLKQRQINLQKQKQNVMDDTTLTKQEKDKQLFENEMKSQAFTNDGKKNASLLEDQAKAAHAAIFKPQKNVAATKDQADTMNLNNLKSKKESDLGAVQNIAKNMLTNPGGAGRLTGQYRNMILGGAALSGVAFTSNKRDYRRGINANKGNRI